MSVQNPYAKYQEDAVFTATPGMLIIMLFENALKHLHQAIRAVNERNIQDAHDAIIQVENIYASLDGLLNENVPISANLRELYRYISKRLIEANMKKDIEILNEVLTYTTEFRDTWKEAEKRIHMQK